MTRPPTWSSLKQGNLCDKTVVYLTDLIVSNHLRTGDFLPSEPELCKRLDVSRGTLREAIRVLEARGFLERRHGVGILVSDKSFQVAAKSIAMLLDRNQATIRDLFEVRVGLECLSAYLAAKRATEREIMAMEDSIEAIGSPTSTLEEYVEADFRFHIQLAECSHNAILITLINLIRNPLMESIRATHLTDNLFKQRVLDHIRVLEAIKRHDSDSAQNAMSEHMKSSENSLRELAILDDGIGKGTLVASDAT